MNIKARPIADIKRDLQDAVDRIEDVRRHGDAAISDYDLMMGYNAQYYLRPNSCLFAHVSYHKRELEEAARFGEQLALEI